MIKVIIIALCTCLASIGGAYGAMKLKSRSAHPAAETKKEKLETLKSRMISVPIIANNEVQGFIVTRLEFVADADLIKARQVPAESVVSDEAFKIIYAESEHKFIHAKKHELGGLTQSIMEGVNKRVGEPVIKSVMIDTWTHLKNNSNSEPKEKPDEHADN